MTSNSESPDLNRRRLITRGGLAIGALGVASAAGVAVSRDSQAAADDRSDVRFDVACLGDTLRVIWAPGAPESGDLRGSTFSVEGAIYEAGTVGAGFDPSNATPTGHWFCRGWYLINGDRPEPHVITTQEYVFGLITADELFPPDQMTSSGTEGTDDEAHKVTRSLTGGAGAFAGAQGQVTQRGAGTNTSLLAGLDLAAPNFTFTIERTN